MAGGGDRRVLRRYVHITRLGECGTDGVTDDGTVAPSPDANLRVRIDGVVSGAGIGGEEACYFGSAGRGEGCGS
jgi:hypothetical protein